MTVMTNSAADQRMSALQKANQVRTGRAALKIEIASLSPMDGRRRVAEILRDPPPCMETVRVHELLRCCRLIGIGKAYRFLARHRVSDARRIGTLTQRQVSMIAAELEKPGVLGSVWDHMREESAS